MRHPIPVAILVLALVATTGAPALAGPLESAQKLYDEGKYDAAADLFAKALKADPGSREAALGLANASVKAGRQDHFYDALDALAEHMKKKPKDVAVRVAMGDVSVAIANTKSDPQALKGYFADAQGHYEAAIAVDAKCSEATVGLAKSLYFVGDFAGAVRAVDTYLSKNPEDTASALYWKGQALYLEMMDAYRSAGALTEDVQAKARQAMGAYAASAAADPTSYDTWIQLGYAAAFAYDETTAEDAYRKAIGTDPTKDAPLKGIASLYANDKEAKTGVLEELAREHPKNEHVLLYAAFDKYEHADFDAAKTLFTQLTKVAADPAAAWYYLGQIAEKQDDKKAAMAAYEKALKANANYPAASGAYGMLLLDGRGPGVVARSMTTSSGRELVKAFEKLFALAPADPWVRNNLGLILRDAWVGHGGQSAWDDLLKSGAAAYESACEIIGEWDDRMASTLPFQTRYGYAQVISDTGLMFQFHPPIKDYEKAVMYYQRALEYSDHGYFDAFNNLRKIYAEQEDWESLYDLAELCADGLVQGDGTPHDVGRAQARAVMKQLLESGKVSGN